MTSLFLLSLLAGLTPACDSLDAARARAVALAYLAPFTSAGDTTTLRLGWADLNDDGLDDALVMVEGAAWCGSGGCTLLVLEAIPEEDREALGPYRIAAEISLISGPVAVSARTDHGWRDLVLHPGTDHAVVLRFDGETYPFSPIEGLPVASGIPEMTRLFADTR
jgi:hypothetical protein